MDRWLIYDLEHTYTVLPCVCLVARVKQSRMRQIIRKRENEFIQPHPQTRLSVCVCVCAASEQKTGGLLRIQIASEFKSTHTQKIT